MPDQAGPSPTIDDTSFSLTIEDAAQLYANAGHPRTLRTIQRYCASGHIDCIKAATTLGDKYYVAPQSVARHIAQIEDLKQLELRSTFRDASGQAASFGTSNFAQPDARQGDYVRHVTPAAAPIDAGSTGSDTARPDATSDAVVLPVEKAKLEGEVERLRGDIDFLRDQIRTKDGQIAALLERDKETNFLVKGLQQMLTPLLGNPRPDNTREQPPPSY